MSAALNRRPRLVQGEPAASPSSADLQAELAQLDNGKVAAEQDLARLQEGRAAVLLAGDDDAAERHDLAMRKAQRAIERADLRRPELVQRHADAQDREAAEDLAERQAEARTVVEAVLDRIEAEYEVPARQIAGLMAAWQEADQLARQVGVSGPTDRLGKVETIPPVLMQAAEYADRSYYRDEEGNPTQNPHPYKRDGIMIDYTRTRELIQERVLVHPEKWSEAGERHHRLCLPDLVNLPAASFTDTHQRHWGAKPPEAEERRSRTVLR